jgi:hypothetical protein
VAVAAALFFARLSTASAADLLADDSEPPAALPHSPYLRTVLGELSLLILGAAWYWGHIKPSTEDLPFTWSTWEGKLHYDDLVFDDDKFITGGIAHPFAGAAYYQVARGNGFSAGASFVAAFVSSAIWQYFGEWNTKPATNDVIVTPAAGWVLGEATFRLGRFFAAGEPGWTNCVGAVLFSPVASLNESRVCRGRPNEPPFDRWGFSERIWHRLDLELGAGRDTTDRDPSHTEALFGVGVRIVAQAAYRQPGAGAVTAWPGQWTSFAGRWSYGGGSGEGSLFRADSLLIGRYLRRYREREAPGREPDGQGLLVGLVSTFDYDTRKLMPVWDRVASVGFAGPVLEAEVRHGIFAVHARLAAAYALAQVASLAYAEASSQFDNVFIKSPLQLRGYYYGQGVVSYAAVEGELGDFRLAFDGRAASYWSINADDTNQSRIQDNFSLHDTRVYLREYATLQPLGGPIRLAVEADEELRDSSIPGTVFTSEERRLIGSVVLVF